jgi:hypothetical protein
MSIPPVTRSSFTQDVFDDVCGQLSSGKTLREICRQPGMPAESTVRKWAVANEQGCHAQYTRAREALAEHMSDEILEIADDATNDWMERQRQNGSIEMAINKEHIERSRQRIDARKWLLSKALPKVYGDKQSVEGKFTVDWAQVCQEAAEKYKKEEADMAATIDGQ